jgi:hypothetical protein
MVTQRKGLQILAGAMMFATSLVLASAAASVTPEPALNPLAAETPAPPSMTEPVPPPTDDQKRIEEPSKNGKTENGKAENGKSENGKTENGKVEKNKGRAAAMLLGIFAVITGHQGATR